MWQGSSNSGGGSVDISDIIDVETLMVSQSSRRNAIYTAGISTMSIVSKEASKTLSLYSVPSGGTAFETGINTTARLVDVSDYNVIYTQGSAATVLTGVTVKS